MKRNRKRQSVHTEFHIDYATNGWTWWHKQTMTRFFIRKQWTFNAPWSQERRFNVYIRRHLCVEAEVPSLVAICHTFGGAKRAAAAFAKRLRAA